MDQKEDRLKFEKVNGSQNHHLFRRPDKDVFWVRFFRTGRGRLEESLKTTNLGEARDRRDRRIAEFLGERPKMKTSGILVGDKFPEFLELKKQKSKATYDSMKNQWENHLRAYFETKLADEVTPSEWLRYVGWKRSQDGMADRKFFNDRKYLAMFLNWLFRDGLLLKVPRLEDVDPAIDAGRALSDAELSALMASATPDLAIQIILAFTMGMRHGEIWSLEWDQINFQKRTIHLPAMKTKIREARTFALSDGAFEVLEPLSVANVSRWVFPHPDDVNQPFGRFGTKGAWEKCRESAGIVCRFHDLRHTFLTRAFKTSTNPALICSYAGLSLEEAYRTYLHFDPEDTKAVASLVVVTWR